MHDIDGNVYHTVKIGNQVWTVENLRVTKYNDGSAIPHIINDAAWDSCHYTETGVYCYYNNTTNADSIKKFGALYNWYAVNTGKLAPAGWHVPSDSEWSVLTTFLGGDSVAGGKLKEVGAAHWLSPNTDATNETGFSALPGGCRDYDGTFSNVGGRGNWWSATAYNHNASVSCFREMYCNYANVDRDRVNNHFGFSVRCVRNTKIELAGCGSFNDDIKTICRAPENAGITNAYYDPSQKAEKLAVYISSNLRTSEGKEFFASLAGLQPEEKVKKLEEAAKKAGLDCCPIADDLNNSSGTVTDADGNVYQTVKIGNQVWTAENLRTTKYNDGTSIPYVTNRATWGKLTTPGYCFYNNTTNTDSIKKFGALYNWYTVNSGKLVPAGWHMPSDSEWILLGKYLVQNGYNWDGTTDMTIDNKIAKSLSAKTDWHRSTNPGAVGNDLTKNNRSDFSALPGGGRSGLGEFFGIGDGGAWWSTKADKVSGAYEFDLGCGLDIFGLYNDNSKSCGFSVRLVKD
jgi:uncharacterized protein (TIGR02145 family)